MADTLPLGTRGLPGDGFLASLDEIGGLKNRSQRQRLDEPTFDEAFAAFGMI